MEDLFDAIRENEIKNYLMDLLKTEQQPSGDELLSDIEDKFTWQGRWYICDVINELINKSSLTRIEKEYLSELVDKESENSIIAAISGEKNDKGDIISTLDALFDAGERYRESEQFTEMLQFIGRFRRYSPYNNMLVKIQNPYCAFYATQQDWIRKFERNIKEDARPMLILAPMHPVMLVYDIDQTEGKELPQGITEFAQFEGEWDPKLLSMLMDNAKSTRYELNLRDILQQVRDLQQLIGRMVITR